MGVMHKMKAVLLAAGKGERLGAVTSEIARMDDQGRAALRFTTLAPLL